MMHESPELQLLDGLSERDRQLLCSLGKALSKYAALYEVPASPRVILDLQMCVPLLDRCVPRLQDASPADIDAWREVLHEATVGSGHGAGLGRLDHETIAILLQGHRALPVVGLFIEYSGTGGAPFTHQTTVSNRTSPIAFPIVDHFAKETGILISSDEFSVVPAKLALGLPQPSEGGPIGMRFVGLDHQPGDQPARPMVELFQDPATAAVMAHVRAEAADEMTDVPAEGAEDAQSAEIGTRPVKRRSWYCTPFCSLA
jgi:hypothetical protein